MRTNAIIKRIVQQMLRDKRTLALLFIAPLLILTLMYFLFNSSGNDGSKLGAVHLDTKLIQVLEKNDIHVETYDTSITKDTMVEDNLDATLDQKDGKWILTVVNSDPTKSKALEMRINQALASQIQAIPSKIPVQAKVPSITTNYVYGDANTTFFDVLSPIMIGFFVFFFVFLISGIGLLRERTTGTLERLMSTPIRRWEVITGYLAGYGMFAIIQTVIVVFYAITVLDITLMGSIWNVLLINLLLALVALSLGILLSTFAASEFQMVQFIPLVVIPQIFFAGIFPLEGMPTWLQAISRIMPLYYGADALKGVMYKGWSFSQVGGDLLALAIFAILFITLNVVALKKYRAL